MQIHYLEIVSPEAKNLCATYEATHNVQFASADDQLGGAKTCILADGCIIGIRLPMHESESPVVRPYWLVKDIHNALSLAEAMGAKVTHPPLEIPSKGTFAILTQGGVERGLWQL